MKPKEFIQRLKNLKVRRFEKNEYAKSIGGGTGLTGNLLDDWVMAVTQGEYTRYEDVPVAEAGANTGWKRRGRESLLSYTAFSVFGGDDPDIEPYQLYQNPEHSNNAIVS